MADNDGEKKEGLETSESENKTIEERLKLLEEENKRLKENKKTKEEMKELSKEQLEYQKKQKELLADIADAIGDTIESAKQHAGIARDNVYIQMQMDNLRNEEVAAIEQAMDEYKKYGTMQSLAHTQVSKALEEQLENFKQKTDLQEGFNNLQGDGLKLADKFGASLGIQKKYKESILGTTVATLKKLNAEGKEGERNREAMKKYLSDLFSYKNIALNIFNSIAEQSMAVFKEFDKAQAALAATTGQGREFNDVLYDTQRNAVLYGVSMADAGKAIGTLVNQTSNFTSMSKAQQQNIAGTVSMMEKLGVSTSDSAAIFQNLNQGLGMTGEQAINMQRDLAMAGVGIGVSAGEITKNFNASLKTLMVYGKESVNVFKGLQAAAKAAGVEVSTLLSIASKFDTFAGAAEGVGKMNALLGAQLSTTQMLMMTEDERIRTLVESVQAQGVAFGDMDRHTQKAIANAAGITDMAEANRIFGMSLSEYDENERKLKASADAQKQFEDAVAKTVPVMDKFKLLGTQIVIALEPVFEWLSETADSLTEWLAGMDSETKEFYATLTLIGAGLLLLVPILGTGGALLTGIGVLGGALLPSLGTAAAGAAPGFTALGASLGAVGTGLFTILGSVALVVLAVGAMAAAFALWGSAVGYVIEKVTDLISLVGGGIGKLFFGSDETEKEVAEFESKATEALAKIVTGDTNAAALGIKQMVEEVNRMGKDVEVRSTIENLALVTAGKASDMNGRRVEASQINVTSNIKNSFEGMKMVLEIGGEKIEGVIKDLAAEAVVDGV
jgi:hypothetical protein